AITTPLKIWMRSFSPSRIRVCTSTVSPMANSGTSVFRTLFSTSSRICWLISLNPSDRVGDPSFYSQNGTIPRGEFSHLCLQSPWSRPPCGRQNTANLAIIRRLLVGQKIFSSLARQFHPALFTPASDRVVVAADEDFGNA